MSREAKLIIFSLILIASIAIKFGGVLDSFSNEKSSNPSVIRINRNPDERKSKTSNGDKFDVYINPRTQKKFEVSEDKKDDFFKDYPNAVLLDEWNKRKKTNQDFSYELDPKNGFSPYDNYFGKGLYNNSSQNTFTIKNSNSTDAVVLLVNAYNGEKIRNEFIRKGTTFDMTGVPDGTYYLEWFSGTHWNSKHIISGKYVGGFQKDASFSKTEDVKDWMKVSGYQQWTITLYSVPGGDVDVGKLNEADFFN